MLKYIDRYCKGYEDVSDIQLKAAVGQALSSLVQQGLIRNTSPCCTGLRGSYEILDDGLEAAAEAFGLGPEDVHIVKNVGSKKLKRR